MVATRGHLEARVPKATLVGIAERLLLCPAVEDLQCLVEDTMRCGSVGSALALPSAEVFVAPPWLWCGETTTAREPA
jgi:hypothetical protein